nr:hypothetical protein [Tanacetum cinerariifolium]
VLPVAAYPIVLGVQWLKTLGPIEFDFNKLTMGFHIAGSHHKLQGLKASELSALKSHELMCICDALLLQIVSVLPQVQPELSPSPAIQKVLTDFCKVFQELSGLPPPRLHDHSVRGFLGLAGYYRKFIEDFGSIAAPLHRMGIGAVLTQNGHPLAYYSAPLKGTMLTWSTYKKEMLALVKSVRKWPHYLLGRPFVVKTDHMSLKYLLEQRLTTSAQARWLPKLLGYDYRIEYKKGTTNRGADALSRQPEFVFFSLSHPCSTIWEDIRREVITNPFYQSLSPTPIEETQKVFIRKDGVWFCNGAIFLSPKSPLLATVLHLSHGSPEGGHFGFHKTLAKLKHNFWWSGMKEQVKQFIRECHVCQRSKSDSMKPAGLLQPLPISKRVWEDISMDFIEGVAREFITNVVRLHGIPSTIVSDRDKLPPSNGRTDGSRESDFGTVPTMLLYGRLPPKLVPYIPGTASVQEVDEYLQDRDSLLKHL